MWTDEVRTVEAGRSEPGTGEAGFGLAGGCVVVAGTALATAGLVPPGDLNGRVAAMAAVVAVMAVVLRDVRACLGVTAVAALIFVGFLDHRYGVLTGTSAWSYTIPIVLAAVLGRALRSAAHAGQAAPR